MDSVDEYTGVFDLSTAEGVNESERYLVRLCRRSFLSLWSHANLHTDQDMRDGRGSAKEFADVLLVFGNDVVIFSDKDIAFQEDKPVALAWSRWYKRAIAASAKQLHGAMGWLQRFPNRVFLDSQCTRPLPVGIPPFGQARFHLVAVARGSFKACAKHFRGSLGTLQIDTSVAANAHEQSLFTVGKVTPEKSFVHVFDEFALNVVMTELDTVTDFVDYLTDREALLTSPGMVVHAAGEEQLVAAYLTNGNPQGRGFLPPSARDRNFDSVYFDESHFEGLRKRPEYLAKKRLDEPSYAWDEIVERFIQIGSPQITASELQQSNHETEQALRLLAAESRFRRRILVEALGTFLQSAAGTGRRRARLFTTEQDPSIVYIFLTVPKSDTETYDEYRRHRAAVLHAYCRCAKLKCPDGITFIGLAVDHPDRTYRGMSEDLLVYIADDFNEEVRAEAERYRAELGILPDSLELQRATATEYPEFVSADSNRSAAKAKSKREKTKKSRAKAARASKRRNRRK
ncbi:hypothetical protein [Ralstonia pseudosolanacearum]|uniref:hypothetical protein n=1 Tax=Ralstonia pseudosolanacearum TaxID=1310165 RepID=UPI0026769AEA|nr:hypothetical protein [Ralstonia pseudosolanacearum]MDO3521956.1 hypothetical protein [Ralstonia pseudosolanacearum]